MKRTLRHLILLVLAAIAVFAMSSIAYGATSLSGKTTISLYGSEYSYTGSPIVPRRRVLITRWTLSVRKMPAHRELPSEGKAILTEARQSTLESTKNP